MVTNHLLTRLILQVSRVMLFILFEFDWVCVSVCVGRHCSWFLQDLKEWIHVAPLQKRSHIWTSDTMQIYLDFLAEEMRSKRRQLELPHSERALIICDQATQHCAKKYEQLLNVWQTQHNAVPCQQAETAEKKIKSTMVCGGNMSHLEWGYTGLYAIHIVWLCKYIYDIVSYFHMIGQA